MQKLNTYKKGVEVMGRGKHFDHKKKNHPGEFPNHTLVERHTTEAQEDEELTCHTGSI